MNVALWTRGAAAGWLVASVVGAGLAASIVLAPARTSTVVLASSAGAVLVHLVGLRLAAWLVFAATIALREPLSVDVLGTKTLYANDVILLGLFVSTLHDHGLARISREAPAFRVGVALLVPSLMGLYGADLPVWAANYSLGIAAQVAIFYVGWHIVRDGRIARWTLVAFLAGMIPAALYGIYESKLPVTAFQEDQFGRMPPVTWDAAGEPHYRVRSTFDHQLRFALALSTAAALALGSALRARSASGRIVLVLAAILYVYCNQFTYSIGGLIGTLAGLFALALSIRGRWTLVGVPLALAGYVAITGETFFHRIDQMLAGETTTAMARWIGYTQTFQILRDHPLLGVGWGNIRSAFRGEYQISTDEVVGAAAENYFLQYAVALGLVGLALTIALCVRYFRCMATKPSGPLASEWPRTPLIVGGTAFWVQVQTFASSDYTTGYILWMLLALAERMRVAHRSATAPIGSGAKGP